MGAGHRLGEAPRLLLRLWRGCARGAVVSALLVGPAMACVTGADYAQPTDRYGHGVLGEVGEYAALILQRDDARVTVTLPPSRVFEDIAPRLRDLTGDGCPEVIVVESDAQLGAQLAIYDQNGAQIAATPPIGRRNRWLAVVGAADLDGDGHVEIAYVDRPHLAKVLRVWRFAEGRLTEVASAKGLTNHRIGWDYIEGGLRQCAQGPEMVLASGDWASVIALRFDRVLRQRPLGPYSPEAIRAAMHCD